eukprot:GHUV01053464.1.p1 GENE.GHUV01053464.1~~GHUV01053464.1.p1  ORF type:complete len:267 (+),score=84.38 GHUV01053464.1:183-983(+)
MQGQLEQGTEAVGPSKDSVAGKPSQGGTTAAIYATTAEPATDGTSPRSNSYAELLSPAYRPSADAASTSYPVSCFESDVLGQCMTTAMEMEASVDSVLDGSIKSAQTMFERYDMNLDGMLNQQDYYDMMLELNLALAVQDYQHFVDDTFNYADSDHDCMITVNDFVPVYKAIATARRAFKHQDHHHNGKIDRHDFQQVLSELEVDPGQQTLKDFAAEAFSLADGSGRGIVNFGQMLWWYGGYLAAVGRPVQGKPFSTCTSPTALIR